jgi:hypothetical protein
MLFQVAPDPPGPFPLRLSIQNNKEFVSRELPDPPGRFSLHVPIKDNKECFLPGLRILQVHFPNNSVFKTIRNSSPGSSGSPRPIFLTVIYLQMSPMYSWAPNLFACYLLSLKAPATPGRPSTLSTARFVCVSVYPPLLI